MSIVSIIGSGQMAATIGRLAARAGYSVEVLGRDAGKAQALAQQIGAGATAGEFGTVPGGDIVILAVPYAAALDVVRQHGTTLAGKLLVDITNPIASDFSGLLTAGDNSGTQEIVAAVPANVDVVKAFNAQFSGVLAKVSVAGRPLDVFLAGKGVSAKKRVSAVIESLGLRAVDTGPLAIAWALERVCMLTLGLLTYSTRNTNFAIGVSRAG